MRDYIIRRSADIDTNVDGEKLFGDDRPRERGADRHRSPRFGRQQGHGAPPHGHHRLRQHREK